MVLRRWTKLSEELVIENPWWKYKRDTFQLPNGREGVYNYVETGGSCIVVPVLPDGKILFVRQYRYLNDKESLELPAGGMKKGSSAFETAQLELREETGFAASKLERIGSFNPMMGVTNEITEVFLARELQENRAAPDETEEFELCILSDREVEEAILSGVIWDGTTIAAWQIASLFLKKL